MACKAKISSFVFAISHVLNMVSLIHCESDVPCYFIFGDSLFDNGNNNLLDTNAKVNYLPYGIDFPQGPTGRFTNGRNIADFIAEFLGFDDYISPFATASPGDILNGLNYASGGAGILEESGNHLGDRLSLDKQLANHKATIVQMNSLIGKQKTKEHLGKCMYTVGIGSNDYINNYFLPSFYPTTSSNYTPNQYAEVLTQHYRRQLMRLYSYGARKVGVFELGGLGCTLFELELYGINDTSSCVTMIDAAVELFNSRLNKLVDNLNNNLLDAKFIIITQISSPEPSDAGFTVIDQPCCVVSGSIGKGQCSPNTDPCMNRSAYVYWDEFHPTEMGMQIIASKAITVLSPFYTFPNDIVSPQHRLIDSLASV